MKNLFVITATALLIVSAPASAWQDNNNSRYGRDDRGYYGGSADSSGNWDTEIQFDVQMRGDGDAEGYVHGSLGEGWDNIEIHRYDNNSTRSDYIRNYRPDYRNDRRSYDNHRRYHRPYYGPDYDERYMGPQR